MQVAPSQQAVAPTAPRHQLVVRIDGRADLTAVEQLPRGPERRRAAFETLRATAVATQREALAALEPLRASGAVLAIQSMLLPNALVVTAVDSAGQQAVRDALRGVTGVGEIRDNKRFLSPDSADGAPADITPASGIQQPPHSWALDAIHARDAWQRGARGQGVTIGVIDTGLDLRHAAVRGAYRGTNADGSVTHDHNWFDGIEQRDSPIDPDTHGTQVSSVAVAPEIGVAPDARIIAARVIRSHSNETVATLQALQWMLAPTRVDGTDPRPELGADIVNNSWGTSNGRDEFFRESLAGLRAAGIEVVTATGNSGDAPSTISAPASYPGFLSVGATDRTGQVASWSSRGPSPLPNPTGARTPLVAAPGLMVPTAKAPDSYVYSSGTSIATPIVAGSLAVLMSAVPHATSAQLHEALTATAVDIDAPGPDDASGHGRIDVAAALEYLAGIVSGGAGS